MNLSELIEALKAIQKTFEDSNNIDTKVYFQTNKGEYLTPLYVEKDGKDVLIKEL